VLFECVTGKVVFDRPGVALAAVHMRDAPPDPATFNPAVPHELSRIILRALASRPEDRWQTAGELLRALEGVAV